MDQQHRQVYALAAVLTAVYCGSLFLHTACASWVPGMLVPVLLYTAFFAVLVWPGEHLSGDLRTSFLRYGPLELQHLSVPRPRVSFADDRLDDGITTQGHVPHRHRAPVGRHVRRHSAGRRVHVICQGP